jgi:hypothetical protein
MSKQNDTFSKQRKDIVDKLNPEIREECKKYYKCKSKDIIDQHGELDFRGIDKIINGNIYQQDKTVEYMGFDTLTIPCDDFKKYKKLLEEDIDLNIFHCYYDKNNPKKIKQFIIVKMSDLIKIKPDGKRKRQQKDIIKKGTVFQFWYYTTVKDIILHKSINIDSIINKYTPIYKRACLFD